MQITVKVKTRAGKNQVQCIDCGHYVVFTTMVPEHGKANHAVIELLAEYLHIGKSRVRIVHGLRSSVKILEIIDG